MSQDNKTVTYFLKHVVLVSTALSWM